jgi:hypothetical protein
MITQATDLQDAQDLTRADKRRNDAPVSGNCGRFRRNVLPHDRRHVRMADRTRGGQSAGRSRP